MPSKRAVLGQRRRIPCGAGGRASTQHTEYIFGTAVYVRVHPGQMPHTRRNVTTTADAVVYPRAPLPRRATGIRWPEVLEATT